MEPTCGFEHGTRGLVTQRLCATEIYSDYTQEIKKLRIVQYLNYSNYVSFGWWDQGKIGIKLDTKYVVY